MKFLDFAMKMELDGKKFYERMSAQSEYIGLKNIFSMLAQDESKHYEVIKALQKGIKPEMADSTVISKAKNLFQNIVAMPESVQVMKKDLDGYRFALKIEADSIKLYEEMAQNESDVDTKSLIQKIIAEEKNHYNIIENIYEFVQKPEYYLAWSEFSNLQTL